MTMRTIICLTNGATAPRSRARPGGSAPMMPTFHLTRIALDEFDAHDATEPPAGPGLQAWCDLYDALLRRVGECFALDTADRNDPMTARTIVDDAAGMAFVRASLTW
jgi:hypothetical protein